VLVEEGEVREAYGRKRRQQRLSEEVIVVFAIGIIGGISQYSF
jgi:hypothetical protein